MLIIRFIFVISLTIVLYKLPVYKQYFCWLKPVCQSPWEILKWLFIPLLFQTLLESLFKQPPIYLPSRLTMIVVGVLVMMLLEYGGLKICHLASQIVYPISYLAGLIGAFLSETIYAQKDIIMHPYDPWFAALGLLFLFLIFVLNTYYPADHWFFKNLNHH